MCPARRPLPWGHGPAGGAGYTAATQQALHKTLGRKGSGLTSGPRLPVRLACRGPACWVPALRFCSSARQAWPAVSLVIAGNIDEICCMELVHVIMEADEVHNLQDGQQAGDLGEQMVWLQVGRPSSSRSKKRLVSLGVPSRCKRQCPSLKTANRILSYPGKGLLLLFYSGLQLI